MGETGGGVGLNIASSRDRHGNFSQNHAKGTCGAKNGQREKS